ncbi:hypothetical protein ES703_14486 [subsurface metagenome]
MRIRLKDFSLPFLLISTVAFLISCASKPIGYGVLLWAEQEGPFRTGEIVRIMKESQLGKNYLVSVGEAGELKELPFFRVYVYTTEDEAEKAALEYAEFSAFFGYSERDGLPIRKEPDQEARKIYRLRAGQLTKILGKSEERVKIAGYEDYWYRVLTEDGFEGYCYGAYLSTFSTQADPAAEAERLMARDPVLDRLLSTVWRPEYFEEMVEKERIDLFRFGSGIGLFPDREKRELKLLTSTYQETFRYEEAKGLGPGRYHFTGTTLRIHIADEERIILAFSRMGQMVSAVYVNFKRDIGSIVAAEKKRRKEHFMEFSRRGKILKSTAYGHIRLSEGMRFSWQSFERLATQASRIFLRPVSGAGWVDFPYYLSPGLSERFDGIITFRFSEYTAQQGTSFLYKFEDSGVRFVFIRPEDILDLEAVRLGITPPVIYFEFAKF